MRPVSRPRRAEVSRRDMFRTGAFLTAGVAAGEPAQSSVAKIPGPEVYTRIGVRPFSGGRGLRWLAGPVLFAVGAWTSSLVLSWLSTTR